MKEPGDIQSATSQPTPDQTPHLHRFCCVLAAHGGSLAWARTAMILAVRQCGESLVLRSLTPGCFQARATPARSGSSLALRRG